MKLALHDSLSKQFLGKRRDTGEENLFKINKDQLVNMTASGGGKNVPRQKLMNEIKIFDIYNDIALVKVKSFEYVDYFQLIKSHDTWQILNILWTPIKKE
jgi:hypothetical protein